MSWINLGEVDYIVRRREGDTAADAVVDDIRAKVDVRLPDMLAVRDAVRIKAVFAMSYADAFAAATSARLNVPVMTGDPELIVTTQAAPSAPTWTWIDLR